MSRKAVSRKAVSRKAVSRKAVSRKAVSRKAVSRKAVSRKAVSRKAVSRKAVSRKAVSRKAVSRKAVNGKHGSRVGSARKPSASRRMRIGGCESIRHRTGSAGRWCGVQRSTHDTRTACQGCPGRLTDCRGQSEEKRRCWISLR
ncbi:histone H1-like repetitive region-containing protein [Microbispora sp. NBC_01389]|uniref:histone H1-like repetitive region-containing protein n=1 Tax=Microbispora sp. NBC_01389 TaxID=2903584 RepID=UPI003869069D